MTFQRTFMTFRKHVLPTQDWGFGDFAILGCGIWGFGDFEDCWIWGFGI